jgi:hypothetical protein
LNERYFDGGLTLRLTDTHGDITTIKASVNGVKVDGKDENIVASFDCFNNAEDEDGIPDLMISLPKSEILKIKHSLEWILRGIKTMENSNLGARISVSLNQSDS